MSSCPDVTASWAHTNLSWSPPTCLPPPLPGRVLARPGDTLSVGSTFYQDKKLSGDKRRENGGCAPKRQPLGFLPRTGASGDTGPAFWQKGRARTPTCARRRPGWAEAGVRVGMGRGPAAPGGPLRVPGASAGCGRPSPLSVARGIRGPRPRASAHAEAPPRPTRPLLQLVTSATASHSLARLTVPRPRERGALATSSSSSGSRMSPRGPVPAGMPSAVPRELAGSPQPRHGSRGSKPRRPAGGVRALGSPPWGPHL